MRATSAQVVRFACASRAPDARSRGVSFTADPAEQVVPARAVREVGSCIGRWVGTGGGERQSVCLFIPHARPSGSSHLANLFSGLSVHTHTHTRALSGATSSALDSQARIGATAVNRSKSPESEFFFPTHRGERLCR